MTKPPFPYIKQNEATHFINIFFFSFVLAWLRRASSSSCCLPSWSLECEKGGNFGYYCDQDNTLKHKLEAFLHSLHVRGRNEAILHKVKLVKEKKVGTLHIIWSRWYSPFKYVVKNDTLVHYFVGSSSMLLNGFKFAFSLIMG